MLLESGIFFLKNVFGQDHFSGEQDLITTWLVWETCTKFILLVWNKIRQSVRFSKHLLTVLKKAKGKSFTKNEPFNSGPILPFYKV